jgi:ligand-binding sensor domain-containing protein
MPRSVFAGRWGHFLPQECVRVIVFDSQNRSYWFGAASSGLIKYDGQRFEKFDLQSMVGGLQTNIINALAADGKFIWIGTNSGLVRYDPAREEWTSYHREDGLVSDSVSAVHVDLSGMLWYGTFGYGVGKFDGTSWYRYDITGCYSLNPQLKQWINDSCYAPGQGLSSNFINAINTDSRGNKFFGTKDRGLSILDSTETLWSYLSSQHLKLNILNDIVLNIASDQRDYKWIGTEGGMIKLNPQNNVDSVYTESPGGLLRNKVNAIWIDNFQNKWIGTNSGVSLLDSTGVRWRRFTSGDPNGGPASNFVRTITGDTDDNVWFGFAVQVRDRCGVSRLNHKWSDLTREDGEGLRSNFVFALALDSNGRLWAGNDLGGVQVFDRSRWLLKKQYCNDQIPGVDPVYVTTILTGESGSVWVGTRSCGLFELTIDSVKNAFGMGNPVGFPSNSIFSLASQGDSVLWIGTDHGLCRLSVRARQCRVFRMRSSIGLSDSVYAVALDKAGNVWAGTAEGLGKYDGNNWTLYNSKQDLSDLNIKALAVDSSGAIWIGTNFGIVRFFDDQWKTFSTTDGLPNNAITAIATDPQGTVWCGTLAGAASFDETSQSWTPYTVVDGPRADYITAITFASQNVVWFSTLGGGVSRYHRTEVNPETQLLTKFDITSDNNVTFQFTGFDLNTPTSQLRYSHKLDFDSWSRPTFDTFVILPIEKNGPHTFYVRAIDKDGNVDESEERLRFTKIRPQQGGTYTIKGSALGFRQLDSLWIYVPPNALQAGVSIHATPSEIDTAGLAEKKLYFTGIAYDLGPENVIIHEKKPLTLTIFYNASLAQKFDEQKFVLSRHDHGEWTQIGGSVETKRHAITTTLKNLGKIALLADSSAGIASSTFTKISNVSAQPRILSPKGGGFDQQVRISFDLDNPAEVTAKVYNLAGRLVRVLCENHSMNAGNNVVTWNGHNHDDREICTTGLYIVTIEAAGVMARKTVMVLNK